MAGYAIEPLNAPLPTAWNLPFQPDAGNQTSILMSESLLGVIVADTRQNDGSAAYACAAAASAPMKMAAVKPRQHWLMASSADLPGSYRTFARRSAKALRHRAWPCV